jgi:ribosome-associated protein
VDLVVRPGPGLPRGLVVPNEVLVERFSRASGPGGQGVNTADSRVELEVTLTDATWLGDDQRRRVVAVLGDTLRVVAAEHRQQRRNRAAARQRAAELLRAALAPPPPRRRPTRPSRAAVERRLAGKRRRADLKAARSRRSDADS